MILRLHILTWVIGVIVFALLVAVNVVMEGWPFPFIARPTFHYTIGFIPQPKTTEEYDNRYAEWYRARFGHDEPRMFVLRVLVLDIFVALGGVGSLMLLVEIWKRKTEALRRLRQHFRRLET